VPTSRPGKKAEEKAVMASIPDYPWLFGPGGQASTSPPSAIRQMRIKLLRPEEMDKARREADEGAKFIEAIRAVVRS